jgi:hypothetical protein
MGVLKARIVGPGQIVWLASYPKSGNTWLRSMLTAYFAQIGQAVDINALEGTMAASRATLDELLGLPTSDLQVEEIRRLLPLAYRAWAKRTGGPHFLKTHDAHAGPDEGVSIFPDDATRCVIHLVRDPRDVVVSAMHHWGLDLDRSIARLNNPLQWAATDARTSVQVPQYSSDWSGHARSWLDSPLPRLTLRYEDMLEDPAGLFRQVLEFSGLDPDPARIEHAVSASRIEKLRAQEQATGFVERPSGATAMFFRSGRAGQWCEALSAEQCAHIVAAHGLMMKRLGYAV